MKKFLLSGAIMLFILLFAFAGYRIYKHYKVSQMQEIKVILVHNSSFINRHYVLGAYKSFFEEEGIPYEEVNASFLASCPVDDIVKSKPAVIFPDSAAQILPPEVNAWVKEYLLKGGNAAIIYDAGTKNTRGNFLDAAVLSDVAGVNYILYNKTSGDAYTAGNLKFQSSRHADFLQIPSGKYGKDLILSGYSYGALEYPIARNELKENFEKESLYAVVTARNGKEYPGVIIRDYGKGKVMYVNLPLGYLKSYADDFPMRTMLRTFFYSIAKVPHVMNIPNGVGGIVFNWHIDDNRDWKSIPYMLDKGLFRKTLEYSIHITAGDSNDKLGDKRGFDACGKGKHLVEKLKDYGTIGSHGGWAHNWFAENIESGKFDKKAIKEQIIKNNDCLESITRQKIVEYSSPDGVHPQPEMTEILQEFGVGSYYYTGDNGSPPNRPFMKGRIVSEKVIAFPVMPFGKWASIDEFKKHGSKTEAEVTKWLLGMLDYVIKNRTVRLVYTHPYDIYDFQEYGISLNHFLDSVEKLKKQGKLQMKPMSFFSDFFLRFLKTQYSFRSVNGKLNISLKNPDHLEGITIALPKSLCQRSAITDADYMEDDDYYYLPVRERKNEKTFSFDMF